MQRGSSGCFARMCAVTRRMFSISASGSGKIDVLIFWKMYRGPSGHVMRYVSLMCPLP